MVSNEFVEETLNKYIKLEENIINKIEENNGLTDFEKEKLKSNCYSRLRLLKDIHFDLLE